MKTENFIFYVFMFLKLSDMTTEMINSEGSKIYPLNTVSKQVIFTSTQM